MIRSLTRSFLSSLPKFWYLYHTRCHCYS